MRLSRTVRSNEGLQTHTLRWRGQIQEMLRDSKFLRLPRIPRRLRIDGRADLGKYCIKTDRASVSKPRLFMGELEWCTYVQSC